MADPVLAALTELFVPFAPGAAATAEAFLATRVGEPHRTGLSKLLTILRAAGVANVPLLLRALVPLMRRSNELRLGLDALRQMIVLAAYGETGVPGFAVPHGSEREPLPTGPVPDACDVVVIGSGAGGSVIAAELAAAGRDVVILEAGHQRPYPTRELDAFEQLYWRGHYQRTVDNLVGLAAGATLGGGTAVNWSNCYPLPDVVRAEWAHAGLDDVATPAFDRQVAAVAERLGVTDRCSDDHGANAVLRRGGEHLGWSLRRTSRNADPATYRKASAGHMGLGDRSGSKLATTSNYLRDAVRDGATIVTGSPADAIVVRAGRAVGVRIGDHVLRAPTVVVAGGAIETPALLLRSGIGGPAVGRYLHLHPVVGMLGVYPDRVDPWVGAPQTTQVDHFFGRGFLLECPAYHPGLIASVTPFRSARAHRDLMLHAAWTAPIIGRIRDDGHGRVTLDRRGAPEVHYPLDPRDRPKVEGALTALAEVHEAAGADAIHGLGTHLRGWRRGEDLGRFIAEQLALPVRAGGRNFMSAHQMGSARMGNDPETSVADPRGELHSTRGVWIGDGSAFPTASGANPMLTIMALARRTAEAMIRDP